MANEISARLTSTGLTTYAVVLDSLGRAYRPLTQAFEAPTAANWALYAIALAEASTTQIYRAAFPVVAAGVYSVELYQQAGGSPATTDPLAGAGLMQWDGAAEVATAASFASLTAALTAGFAAVLAAITALPQTAANVAAAVWAYATRRLTQPAVEIEAAISGSELTIRRGDSWTVLLTGLGSLAGRTKLWFTVKRSHQHADAQAVIQIEATTGLLVLEGAAPGSASWGSLTVDDQTAGDITLTLTPAATILLTAGAAIYDVKWLDGSGRAYTLTEAAVTISKAVTYADS